MEAAALWIARDRLLRFALVSGTLIGTVGLPAPLPVNELRQRPAKKPGWLLRGPLCMQRRPALTPPPTAWVPGSPKNCWEREDV